MNILPHVKLLGSVCGKGVGSRQIGNIKRIALVLETGHLAINRYPAVVTHMFPRSRCVVKQGCFPCIRITYKHNVNLFASNFGFSF